MNPLRQLSAFLLLLCAAGLARAEDQTATYRIIGLSAPERQDDWRQVMETLPDFHVIKTDFAKAETTLQYDLAALFPNAKVPPDLTPEKTLVQLNEQLRKASRGTFILTALSAVPADKLTELDLKIGILDCKACRYGAYISIAKMDGVERASIDPEKRILSAWIDPEKTNRGAIEEALKKVRVELPAP